MTDTICPWRSRWQHGCARVEEALLGLRTFEQLRVPQVSAITIVCDDGHVNDWKLIAPLLDEHGARATLAVVSARVGQSACLNRSQLEALVEAGHESACHGCSHMLLSAPADGPRRSEDAMPTRLARHDRFGRKGKPVRTAANRVDA